MRARDLIVAVDVGGTHIRMGMVDTTGGLTARASHPSSMVDHPEEGPARLVALLRDQIDRWESGRPAALALGFPSTVSRDRRTVLQTPNLRGFDSAPIAELLEKTFKVPVLIEKDVVFLLAHDIEALGLRHDSTTIGIYFGTGIGNAIFMNGSFFTGKNGVAGELGHIPVRGAQRECGCHNIGCMETEASGGTLARLVSSEFPGEHVADVFERHGDSAAISAFLESMSQAPAVEINILDPDEVVLGGGVVRMRSFPREGLRQRILAHVRRPLPHEGLRIHFSAGDEYGGVLGGARLAARMLNRERGGA